ncbi:MAG: hypothetical protein M8353_02620 [ANME-2 cluster archaeon]|nr:hypothetical protein [ANME-2 cluster archaeon]
MTVSLNFFKQYHCNIVKALGDDAKKVNAKVGSIMADEWLSREHVDLNDPRKFKTDFKNYLLNELEFARDVDVEIKGNDMDITVKGCVICHGNELLRQEGMATACPIVQTSKYAVVKGLKKNVTMKGVDKPGVVGECVIRFELQ